jgi:hypothetical protein
MVWELIMFGEVRERTKQEDRPMTDRVPNSVTGHCSNMKHLRSTSQDTNSSAAILGDRDQDEVRRQRIGEGKARCT